MRKHNKRLHRISNNWKSWLALCLSLLLLAGCAAPTGDGNSEPGTENGAEGNDDDHSGDEHTEEDKGENSVLNKDVIYRETLLDLQLPMTREMKITSGGGVVYLWGQNWETDSSMNTTIEHIIVCCDPVTGEVSTVYPKEGQVAGSMDIRLGDSISGFAATQNGDLVILTCSKISWSEEHYRLVKVDRTGKLLWQTDIGNVDMRGKMACSDRYVYAVGDKGINVYDLSTGASVTQIDWSGKGSFGLYGIRYLCPSTDGKLYVGYMQGESPMNWTMAVTTEENWEVGEPQNAPWRGYFTGVESGLSLGNVFMMYNETSVAVGNDGSENFTEKINLLDSGIDGSTMIGLTAVKEGLFWAIRRDMEENGKYVEKVYSLTKLPPEEVKEKTVITIACPSTSALRERILAFNRENTEYQVKVIDYSIYPSYPTNERLTRLNLDMISENAPDILYLKRGFGTVDDYIRQGLLEDLNTWIDADPEIDRGDYLNNIFEAYEVNGGLYELPTSFVVSTLSADQKFVGSEPGLTMEELKQLEKEYPEYRMLGTHIGRDSFLMLQFGTAIDTVNGTCSFDSPEFMEILEMVKRFTEEDGTDQKTHILNTEYLRNFEDFRRKEIQHNPQRIQYTYIGFPGVGGSGALINNNTLEMRFAITSQSENKEGAWQFIRYFLGDEYQNQVATGSAQEFPVKSSALELQAENATKPISADGRDEDGIFTVPGLSEARVDELMEYLKSLNQTVKRYGEVYNIVVEEAGAFFAGQKTVQDVAKTIQGRVWIYLAEQQ